MESAGDRNVRSSKPTVSTKYVGAETISATNRLSNKSTVAAARSAEVTLRGCEFFRERHRFIFPGSFFWLRGLAGRLVLGDGMVAGVRLDSLADVELGWFEVSGCWVSGWSPFFRGRPGAAFA